MTDATLRGVDRWLGVPGCVALTLHRRLLRRHERSQSPRRLVFVKLAEQGSTVLAAPALERAAGQLGRENVFFLTCEENRFILDVLGILPAENVVTLDVRTPVTAASSLVAAVRRMHALSIDAAINLEFFARSSAILAYLSGATLRVGLHSFAGEGAFCGDLLTHRLVYNPYLHTRELFLVMLDALRHDGGTFPALDTPRPPAPDPLRPYDPSEADRAAVRRLLREVTGLDDLPPLILLNANCRDALPLRRWDPRRYVDLARRLIAAVPDVHVIFTGAPAEAIEAESLGRAVSHPRCASLGGRTTVRQLLTLFGFAEVLVTNDSGPAHFAALTPIDVVTLFGPETPTLFAAPTPRNHVIWAGLVCSPCVSAFNNRQSKCHDAVCMRRITVDEVFDTVLSIYRRRRSALPPSGPSRP